MIREPLQAFARALGVRRDLAMRPGEESAFRAHRRDGVTRVAVRRPALDPIRPASRPGTGVDTVGGAGGPVEVALLRATRVSAGR